MGLREWLIILGGVVLLLIIADGIRRMRKNSREEEELDPEERARQEQIRRELPNGGARVIKEHDPEIFENDPVPVLKYEVEVPEGTLQEMEFNAADIPDRELPEGAKRYSVEDYQHLFKKAEPEEYPEADAEEAVIEQKTEPELDNTDSSYFDAFCHPGQSAEPEVRQPDNTPEPVQADAEEIAGTEVMSTGAITEDELTDFASQVQTQKQTEMSDDIQVQDTDAVPVLEESSVLEDDATAMEPVSVSAQSITAKALEAKPSVDPDSEISVRGKTQSADAYQAQGAQENTVREKAEPDDLELLDLDAAFAAEQAKLLTEQELQREAEALFPETAPKTKAKPVLKPEPEDPVKAAALRIMGKHVEDPRPSEKMKLEEQRKAALKAKEAVAKEQAQNPKLATEKVKSEIGSEPKTSPFKEKKVAHKPLMTEEEERAQFSNAVELLILHVKAKDPEGFPGSVLLHIALACGMQVGEMGVFHRYKKTEKGTKIEFSMVSSVNPGTFDIDNIDDLHVPGVSFIMALPSVENSQECFHMMHETAKVVVKNLNGELRDENRGVMTQQTYEHYRQRIQDFERRRQLAGRATTRT